MTNTIPNTPTLREVLDRGDDPADLLGGFDFLDDLVVRAGVAEDDEDAVRGVDILNHMVESAEESGFGVTIPPLHTRPNFMHMALMALWELELVRDRDLLGRLLREHPRGAELTERVARFYEHSTLSVVVVCEDDYEVCNVCGRSLQEGERALVHCEIALCFPCLRPALDGVDLEDQS